MSSFGAAALSIGTLILGWLLNEVSHRRRLRDEDRRHLAREHRTIQTNALTGLQRAGIEYATTARRLLYAGWEAAQVPDDRDKLAEVDALSDELDAETDALFAARAMVDDLRIRSYADYLEEMARQFISSPGEPLFDGAQSSKGEEYLWRQDDDLQSILWRLNNYIGSRLLDLVGVVDPETPPYRGE